MELSLTEKQDYTLGAEHISEITAVFTTANAKLRLYRMLDWLHPSQIIYCDTASVICMYDKTNPYISVQVMIAIDLNLSYLAMSGDAGKMK